MTTTSVLPAANRAQVRRAAARLVRADRAAFATALVLNVAAAAAGLISPLIVGHIVTAVQTSQGLAVVDRLGLVLVVAAVAQFVMARFARSVGNRFGERTSARLREQVVGDMLNLDARSAEHIPAADLASRGSVDVGAVTGALRAAAPDVVFALIQAVIIAAATLWLSPVLGLCGIAGLTAIGFAVRWYLRRARDAYLEQGAAFAAAATVLAETTDNARTVELLGLQQHRTAALVAALERGEATMRRTLALRSRLFPTVDASYGIAVAAVVAVGGGLLLADRLSLGVVVAAALYIRQLSAPLDTLFLWTETLQSAGASFARIEGLTAAAPATPAAATPASPADETISLVAVNYAYRSGRDVLHEVSLTVAPGARLAIVGVSGAGKTTVGRLIAGVDRPRTGSATVGGVPIADLPPEVLREHVIMVTQDHYIFRDTVRNNLALAAPAATDEELMAALRTVGARWLDELPDGLDTELADRRRLDGGQAQHIALARVVLADPHTVVLDEATALLDPRTARATERALSATLTGRTVVAIAHRLHTAHDADHIVVLDEGRITATGTHESLLAQAGSYARMWNSWARRGYAGSARVSGSRTCEIVAVPDRRRRIVGTGAPAGCRIGAAPFVEWSCGHPAAAEELPGGPARRRTARGEGTTVPRYLIAFNDEWVPAHSPEELRSKSAASKAVLEEMKAAGVFVFADGGIDASTALCSVVSKDGQPVFTDGPYVETKEHLGGFTVIEAADDEAARFWAGRLAVSLDWPQEVHRFPSGVVEIIERQTQHND